MLPNLFARQRQGGSRQIDMPYRRFFGHFRPEGPAVAPASQPDLQRCQQRMGVPLPDSLQAFLRVQNGGYFNGGLIHICGACRPLRHDDLYTWNQAHDWKSAFAGYGLENYIFFADDIYGNLFGFEKGPVEPAVIRFDIHFGEYTEMAPSIATFLDELLVDEGGWLLGGDFLQSFRDSGSAIAVGKHLSLVIPSLLGGSMEAENLCQMDPPTNLYLAGQVLTQVKPLPPGTEVRGFRFDPRTLTLKFEAIGT